MRTRVTIEIPKLITNFYDRYSISLFFEDFIWKFFIVMFFFTASWQFILICTLVAFIIFLWIICSPSRVAKIARKILSKFTK